MDPSSPVGTSVSPTSNSMPSSLASSSSPGQASESSTSFASGLAEHTPTRRRLVKASSRIHFDEQAPRVSAKREGGPVGVGSGPPGFGLDRTSGGPSTAAGGPVPGQAVTPLGVSSSPAGINNVFRERTPGRPVGKGDAQVDYPLLSPHGPVGTSGLVKLGRPPFATNPGVVGDIRPLGRRPESLLQRRHESLPGQKHAPEDIRIQQAKRACMARAQTMGATGNYKNFDSPFGNYMVPVIPNHLVNKTPVSTAPSIISNASPGIQGR